MLFVNLLVLLVPNASEKPIIGAFSVELSALAFLANLSRSESYAVSSRSGPGPRKGRLSRRTKPSRRCADHRPMSDGSLQPPPFSSREHPTLASIQVPCRADRRGHQYGVQGSLGRGGSGQQNARIRSGERKASKARPLFLRARRPFVGVAACLLATPWDAFCRPASVRSRARGRALLRADTKGSRRVHISAPAGVRAPPAFVAVTIKRPINQHGNAYQRADQPQKFGLACCCRRCC